MSDMIDDIKRFVEMTKKIDELEDGVKVLKKERADLERQIKDDLVQSGVQNVRVAVGDKTPMVYLHGTVGVSPRGSREAVIKTLQKLGMNECVDTKPRFVTQSLTAWINAQKRAGLEIPDELREVLKIEDLCFVRIKN